MAVHTRLGPGLLESVYEVCLMQELRQAGIRAEAQVRVDVGYGDRVVASGFRIDLLVEDSIVVELKAVDRVTPLHEAQVQTYLRLACKPVGLLINFNTLRLKNGIKRLVLNPKSPPLRPSAPSASSAVDREGSAPA